MNRLGKVKIGWSLLITQLFMAQLAMAQVGGFVNQAKTMMENIRDGIVIIVGVVATIALLWQVIKKSLLKVVKYLITIVEKQ